MAGPEIGSPKVADERDFYRTVERDYWASAWGSKPDEDAVLERYLDPARSTIEAGTGNGRILQRLRERGFERLAGFDFAPELIAAARERDPQGAIELEVADARDLPYPEGRFEQAIYLSQITSTFASPSDRQAVLAEAARILSPGGTAIVSFLPYEARRSDPRYRPYLAYLKALRRLRRVRRDPQLLPRLRASGRFNAGALRDAPPHTYWYRAAEAEAALAAAGLGIEALGSTPQVLAGTMRSGAAELEGERLAGTLYAVCRKPRS